jgi:hypothetical protein
MDYRDLAPSSEGPCKGPWVIVLLLRGALEGGRGYGLS